MRVERRERWLQKGREGDGRGSAPSSTAHDADCITSLQLYYLLLQQQQQQQQMHQPPAFSKARCFSGVPWRSPARFLELPTPPDAPLQRGPIALKNP